MVESAAARVDFATAEALAFGTLMLHRGAAPAGSAAAAAAAPEANGGADAAAAGLNFGHYGERFSGQQECAI